MKIVRFKGKFRDLIPAGWTFQKLFARNYRQYHKTCDGDKYSQGCRIWQHHGGYLEVDELFPALSAVFVEKIINGQITDWASKTNNSFSKQEEIVYWFMIDREECRFIPYHSPEYKELRRIRLFDILEMSDEDVEKHVRRYREWNTGQDLITMLKDLIDKGWITVEDDPQT